MALLGKVIVLASGKGGTGKTSAVAALSACLAMRGCSALCLDLDVGMKNLDLSLGLSDLALMDFSDILHDVCKARDAIVAHPAQKNLYYLASPSAGAPENFKISELRLLLAHLKRRYDFVLIDSPAGIGRGFRLAARAADAALLVVTADAASYRDAARVMLELAELGVTDARLIVNRVRPQLLSKMKTTIDDAVDAVGARLIGVVPEDRNVLLSAAAGSLLPRFDKKGASAAFGRISGRLLGQNIPLAPLRVKV